MNGKTIPVDCAQFETVLHDLDRPGTEGFALRGSALAHAEACSRCARLMIEVEALDFSLRGLAAQEADLQAPSRVGTAASQRRVRWQVAVLGTAAALLLALGVSLGHRGNAVLKGGLMPGISAGSASQSGRTAASADSQQSPALDVDPGDSEYATAFVPLPYADDPTAADGGTVVRVVLSRSALASLGLPVTDMEETDQIPADIVLSEDGAPQAIRLVSQVEP